MSATFILYDILVTGIELPGAIVAAINRKTEQYYIAEEYKFRVEREKRESERKKIEAEGIRFAIHECENSHHRQRQRRSADHPWQCGYVTARGKHAADGQ